MTHELVFPDTAPQAADPLLVGHKFARQARLRAAGYRVPEFACASVGAFDAMRAGTGIHGPAARDRREAAAWAGRARARVRHAGVPDDLAKALLDVFDRLADDSGTVAVRSCAVPSAARGEGGGQDLAAEAFAGPGGGLLMAGRDELIDVVSECWASAFTEEGVLCRVAQGGDPAAARMAVGIQRLVPANRSFAAFSRDPRCTPQTAGRTLIAAAYGLGEGVVQERADVDHFSVERGSRVVEFRTVRKTRQVVPASSGGTIVAGVPGDLADCPVLDVPTTRRIAEMAVALESDFGTPQHIEGALTADGEIHLLQARPVVVTRTPQRRLH